MLLGHGHMAMDSRKLIFLDVAWTRWMGHVSADCAVLGLHIWIGFFLPAVYCQYSTASLVSNRIGNQKHKGISNWVGRNNFQERSPKHTAISPKSGQYRLKNWRKPQESLIFLGAPFSVLVSCCHLCCPGRWCPCHFATDPRARRCWLGATGCLLRAEPGRGGVDLIWHCKMRRAQRKHVK
jgi:hypothetical protein